MSVGVVASVGATAVPAAASTPKAGVTVFLKAPNLASLHQLAAAHGLSHAQRVAALRRVLPSAAQHRAAADALRAAGLTVTDETAWSVSATGSGTGVTDTFGARPVMRAHATAAQRRAATGPYPSLPASLRGVATAAYPTTAGPKMFHNSLSGGLLLGSDFRNANASPDATAHGQPPASGSDPAATLTIATVQFASWNPSDLTTWANTANIGVPGFDAATQLTTVPVDQPSVPKPVSGDDGDVEVDLDQEGLLSTDPFAHQRVYFAPNTASGYFDAVAQVLDDVTQDGNAVNGGDPHIVALSSSWGLCELDSGDAFINAMEPVFTSLQAAGVTTFASSGDDGIYDQCSTSGPHVDYPASSPEVVGVGGTALAPVGSSAANNGANWTETAWGCTGVSDCDSNGGSGGGVSGDVVSSGFAKPSYQGVITSPPFARAASRMVPDIAADADPDTGFPGYTSDPDTTAEVPSGMLRFGGTSLAAPLSAALFTDALAAHAVTAGVGEIHSALYGAFEQTPTAFRDVTAGTNGAAADAGNDPSVSAAAGYDTVTGLGAPIWPDVVARVLDPLSSPTATASLSLSRLHSSSAYQVSASWTGSSASGGLAVQQADVEITRSGQAGAVYSDHNAPANGSHTFTAKPGSTYTLTVTSRDVAGATSIPQVSKLVVPVDDKAFTFSGTWQRQRGSNDIGGSLAQTSHRKAAGAVTATGRKYSVVVATGPSYGKLLVGQGRHPLGTINLYAAHNAIRRVTFFSAKSARSRTFEFVCLGKKSASSSSTTVAIDALYAER